MPEFVVAMGVLVWLSTNRRDPRLWAPLAGAVIGYFSWTLRPAELHSAALFAPVAPSHWTLITAAQAMARLLYGVQGQVLSHYGYGAFAWSWIIATIWVARSRAAGSDPAARDLARRFGWIGLTAWLVTLGLYAALTFLGQPQMSTLFVIRTGFGRHLVHFYPFCLLAATAAAERLTDA